MKKPNAAIRYANAALEVALVFLAYQKSSVDDIFLGSDLTICLRNCLNPYYSCERAYCLRSISLCVVEGLK